MSAIETIRGRPVSRLRFSSDFAAQFRNRFALWSRIYRTRKQLLELPDSVLEDLGLTREAARKEAARPFWDTAKGYRRQQW